MYTGRRTQRLPKGFDHDVDDATEPFPQLRLQRRIKGGKRRLHPAMLMPMPVELKVGSPPAATVSLWSRTSSSLIAISSA